MTGPSSNQLVSNYYLNRTTAFSFYLEKTKVDFGVEDLHRLRVEIKKLKAFFRLLNGVEEIKFKIKPVNKILSPIFKPGGFLRETQVNQQLVKLYRSYSLEDYNRYLSKRVRKQEKRLKKSLLNFRSADFEEFNQTVLAQLSDLPLVVIQQRAFEFINSELAEIRQLRSNMSSDRDLHQIRTHTKALGYIAKFINQIFPTTEVSELLTKAKFTEKLIGNWHDRIVLRDSLMRYLKKHPDTADKAQIERLVSQIGRQNKRYVSSIAIRLDEFIFTNL